MEGFGEGQERNGHPWELYDLASDPTEMNDQARGEADRRARMTSEWDAWAARVGLTTPPPRTVRGTIDLRPGQTLAGGEAPDIANVPFRIEAEVRGASQGGVIASQRAQVQGWSLFVRDRKPVFTVRRNQALLELTGDRPLGDEPVTIAGELREGGAASLLVGGVEVAHGTAGGFITARPNEPLIVADDLMGAVGSYQTPRPFLGSVRRARLTVGGRGH